MRPAVVGTSTPPSWISGAIRRGAFHYSESDWRHWPLLLGADRVNMVEGVVQDLGRGRFPDIPGEMGVRAELRHNKAGFAKKLAVAGAASAVLYILLRSRDASGRNASEPQARLGEASPTAGERPPAGQAS